MSASPETPAVSIAQRLDAMESRAQISELRANYAWFAARGDSAAIAELFAEDGVFESRTWPGVAAGNIFTGRAAIRDGLSAKAPGAVVPLVANETVSIDGDHAVGKCTVSSPVAPNLPGGFVGFYEEELVRSEGRWVFARRIYTLYPRVSA